MKASTDKKTKPNHKMERKNILKQGDNTKDGKKGVRRQSGVYQVAGGKINKAQLAT